jgi:hypothetical protein
LKGWNAANVASQIGHCWRARDRSLIVVTAQRQSAPQPPCPAAESAELFADVTTTGEGGDGRFVLKPLEPSSVRLSVLACAKLAAAILTEAIGIAPPARRVAAPSLHS